MSKRSCRRIIVALLLISIGGMAWKLLPRERLLLAKSQRLLSAPLPHDGSHQWLNDHDLLKIAYFPSAESTHKRAYNTVFRMNVHTSDRQPLPTLATRLGGVFDGNARLSPDGMYLLWTHYAPLSARDKSKAGTTQGEEHWGEHSYTMPIDGSQPPTVPSIVPTYQTYTHWLADSRHWVELVSTRDPAWGVDGDYSKLRLTRIVVHDVMDSSQTRTLPIAPNHPLHPVQDSAPFYDVLHTGATSTSLLCDDMDRRAYFFQAYFFQDTKQVHVLKIDVMGKADTQRYTLSPPSNVHLWDMLYSPDGNTIAWYVERDAVSPVSALLHRWLPKINTFNIKPQTRFELWISRIDGTGLHEIGHIQPPDYRRGGIMVLIGLAEKPFPNELKWLPDSRHISFMYRSAMYVVPTD